MTTPTLREQTRQAVRDQVMTKAWELFAAQGFSATTVEQVADAAGMSKRSFFRYFDGKEELVLDRLLESGVNLADDLRARPPEESAWTALHAAFQPMVLVQEEHREIAVSMQVMLRDPALAATLQTRQRRWQELLMPLVASRLQPPRRPDLPDPRPAAVTGAALLCLYCAQYLWADDPTASLGALLDEAMTAVAPLG